MLCCPSIQQPSLAAKSTWLFFRQICSCQPARTASQEQHCAETSQASWKLELSREKTARTANGMPARERGIDSGCLRVQLGTVLARAQEFAALAQDVAAEQRRFRMTKDRLSIARRDVRKLITVGFEEGATGDWRTVEDCFVDIVERIPRRPTLAELIDLLDEMTLLHEEVVSMLEIQQDSTKMVGNANVSGRHIQDSQSESLN
jgi:hypothetical protein